MDAAVTQALAAAEIGRAAGGERVSLSVAEWAGHAPILEEDIALANIALDEMGHAAIWYSLYAELTGDDPDRLVFFRKPGAYRNVQMVELPKGDWAFTLVRQYLFDAAESVMLPHLRAGTHQPLAEAAAKIATEEVYHLRHSGLWLRRLGLGTEESHARTQAALDTLWPYAVQLFALLPEDELLVAEAIIPDPSLVHREWDAIARSFLTACGLHIPADTLPRRAIPRSEHTEHLMRLLAEMQSVARLDPAAEW